MELRVQLKVCEGCGCLWYRPSNLVSVYCLDCREKLEIFPNPETRKHRGRPRTKTIFKPLAMAAAEGGAK
jgi:hypothetical protein